MNSVEKVAENDFSLSAAWDLFKSGDLQGAKIIFSGVPQGASDLLRAEAFYGLGKIAEKNNKTVEAVKYYIDAIRRNSGYVDVHLALGDLYLANGGQYMPALECYGQAVAYDPERYECRRKLIHLVCALEFKTINPNLKGVLTACLEHDDLYLLFFANPWKSILTQDKQFISVWNASKYKEYDLFAKFFSEIKDYSPLLDPFFLYGLGKFIVNSREFEQWIVNLRHYLLDLHVKGQYLFEEIEKNEYILCALSRYAFYVDYVFNETESEAVSIKELQEKIESGKVVSLCDLALYACYRPLCVLKNAQEISENLGDIKDHVSQIPKKQISEYLEQQNIKKEIIALTRIDDKISQSVREQYEEFPYPRWGGLFKSLSEHKIESRFKDKKIKVLIADCGTGQEALEIAASFPQAEVLAVDLSKTSLAYAMMRQRQLGIQNITFKQADIMLLGEHLKQDYDFISSSGVLRHLEDPKAGWKVLYDLLKPDGTMRIALYSSLARRAVNVCRHVISENNIGNDVVSIREFRKNIDQYLSKQDIQYLERFIDYSSLPMVRDLLFHVQEHQYDLLQVKEILDELRLEFLGFNVNDGVLKSYKKFAKKDPDATNLELWHKFEQKNPDTFMGMYTFWCEKS